MRKDLQAKVQKAFSKSEYACYVLITCSRPKENGSMDVELHYEGDTTLASYLVHSAGEIFEKKFQQDIENDLKQSS